MDNETNDSSKQYTCGTCGTHSAPEDTVALNAGGYECTRCFDKRPLDPEWVAFFEEWDALVEARHKR